MRKPIVTMIAACSLLALPALAQSSNSGGSSSGHSSGNGPPSMQQVQQTEQTLRQDLAKAGYTDIKIAPGSFLVHAKDSKGEPLEMMVTPNSVTAITAMNELASSSQGGTSSNSSSSNHK